MDKIKGILGILILIGFLGSVSAISSDLKENYAPKESIIIEISGNILEPISSQQIEFRRGHVSVPVEYDVKRLGERYFLWAIAPENENNYTLIINDVATTVSGKVEEIDYEKNFSVVGDLIDYSVKPGFVFAKEDFEIVVELYEDLEKEIMINFPVERNVVLKPGVNELDFSIEEIENTQFILINIGQYNLPAYIIGGEKGGTEAVLPVLRFNPRILESTILKGSQATRYPFSIINSGGEEIELALDYNKDLFVISPNSVIIKPEEIAEFNLSLNEIGGEINESIYARSGDFSLEMPVNIMLTENIEEIDTPYLKENFNESSLYYCSELEGVTCSANEVCSGESVSSLDGACCKGQCGEEEDEGSGRAFVGYAIAALVLIVILFVFFRYRKAKANKAPLEKKIGEIERRG